MLFLVSLATHGTADMGFTGVTLVENSGDNVAGTSEFTLAWSYASNVTSTTVFTNAISLQFDGLSSDPQLFTEVTPTFSSSDCTVTADMDVNRNIMLSFVCVSNDFPDTPNNVVMTLKRSTDTSIACDSYAPYVLSPVGVGSISPQTVAVNYYFDLCGVSFSGATLTSALSNGAPVVIFSWTNVTESTHKIFNPTLSIGNVAGDNVFASVSSNPITVAGSDNVTVSATMGDGSVGDTITLLFSIPTGKKLPTIGSFIIPATTIGAFCPNAYSGDYTLSPSPANRVTVAGVLTTKVKLASCPQLNGVSVTVVTHKVNADIIVAWTNFTNADNLPASALSELKFRTDTGDDYPLLAHIVDLASVVINADTGVDVTYNQSVYTLKFTTRNNAALPSSGSFMFRANLTVGTTCESTSSYHLSAITANILSVSGDSSSKVLTTVNAALCPVNRFKNVMLTTLTNAANAAAGSVSLRLQWTSFTENFGFDGSPVFSIVASINTGLFPDFTQTLAVYTSANMLVDGITVTARHVYSTGQIAVTISKTEGVTFPTSGYFDLTPPRLTGEDAAHLECDIFDTYTVSSANISNIVSVSPSGSLSSKFVWQWCPVQIQMAELAFNHENEEAWFTLYWEAVIATSDNPLVPELRVVMDNGLFKAMEDTFYVNKNTDYPVTAKISVDGGPLTLTFTDAVNKPLPQRGGLDISLDFMDSIEFSCTSQTKTNITVQTSNSTNTLISNDDDSTFLHDVAHTPSCPNMSGVTVTQNATKITLAWTGYINEDYLQLKLGMVSLKITPATSSEYVFQAVKTSNSSVMVEENKFTHYALLTDSDGDLFVSFYQNGTHDMFPHQGSITFETVLVSKCGVADAAQQLRPAATKGLGMYAVASFTASTPGCISAFSGVLLTTTHANDSINKTAIMDGSTGFRFSWTDFQSNATRFNRLVNISVDDASFSGPSLLDDEQNVPASLHNPATDAVLADWNVEANVVNSVITLSFIYNGIASPDFPKTAYVDVKPPRSQQAHNCDNVELYVVAKMDGVATFAPVGNDQNALVAPYVWAYCQIEFENVKLTTSVGNSTAKLAVAWADLDLSDFNIVTPVLEIRHVGNTVVYAETWGPQTVVINSEANVTAQSTDGVISLTFTLAKGTTMPSDADFTLTPDILASAHSCS